MNDERRRAAAHLLVADVDAPVLDDNAAHHLFRVLRVRAGETVTVTDGCGRWRRCVTDDGLIVPTADVVTEPAASPLTIAVAVPKQDRPEWIVQKLTELGATRIVFVHAARSVVRWDAERAAKNLAKLGKVAVEAMQQSRRVWLPTVEGPLGADEILGECVAAEPGGRPLRVGDRAVAVGPEGGWTADELALAADTVSISDGVLRVETAALAAATLMQRADECDG